MVEIKVIDIEIPQDCNVIVGQSHFIKSVFDIYETLVESGTGLKFGFAFCEASGKRLIRSDGNDDALVKHAEKEAMKVSSGHLFIVYIKNGYPINVLNRLKQVSEVVTIFAATANPLQVIIAETVQGRGVMGVIDGQSPLGFETPEERQWRSDFIRKLGYKR